MPTCGPITSHVYSGRPVASRYFRLLMLQARVCVLSNLRFPELCSSSSMVPSPMSPRTRTAPASGGHRQIHFHRDDEDAPSAPTPAALISPFPSSNSEQQHQYIGPKDDASERVRQGAMVAALACSKPVLATSLCMSVPAPWRTIECAPPATAAA
jgi:hypothetical protein